MPIEADTSQAPALLRMQCVGEFPTAEEVSEMRECLIRDGFLNESTVSLIDVRGITGRADDDVFRRSAAALLNQGPWPRRRACLINPGKHLQRLQLFQAMAPPGVAVAGFLDEKEALEWLLNPEGAAAFKR